MSRATVERADPDVAPGTTGAVAGDVAGVLVNAAMLVAVNIWPGWWSLPFLTEESGDVLALVNLSLAAGAVAPLVYLVAGTPLVRALGGLVTTSIGLAAAVRLLQVFPFEDGGLVPVVARIVLVVAVVGAGIGVTVQLVTAARAARRMVSRRP